MDPTGALLLAVAVAGLLVAAFGRRKAKALLSGVIRDSKGRLCLVLTPARHKRGGRKHGRRRI